MARKGSEAEIQQYLNCYTGVPLSPKNKKKYIKVFQAVSKANLGLEIRRPRSRHISTLCLGNLTSDEFPQIVPAVRQVQSELSGNRLRIGGTRLREQGRTMRIFINVEDSGALVQAHYYLKKELGERARPEVDFDYFPHVSFAISYGYSKDPRIFERDRNRILDEVPTILDNIDWVEEMPAHGLYGLPAFGKKRQPRRLDEMVIIPSVKVDRLSLVA
jgi:2'-5' RNA ligase